MLGGGPDGRPARALVVVLHGFGLCKEQMLPWALDLASQGYRVALVDLRGHGQSTGDWVGFGALEQRDLSAVVDTLEHVTGERLPVGVLGVSYGDSVGLQFAAHDPRVQTVVALEPFSSAELGIPELARAAFPEQATRISDRMFTAAFRAASRRGGFPWAETDVLRSLPRVRGPVLLIHGEDDTWLSPAHSERLHARACAGSRLLLVPGTNHITLPLEVGRLAPEIRTWFDQRLGGGPPESRTASAVGHPSGERTMPGPHSAG